MENKDFCADNIPRHVGIIMDGNRRWAKIHNKPVEYGHKKGAEVLENVAKTIFNSGVTFLSVYAFSTENINRSKEEVDSLFDILQKGIKKYGNMALKSNVKFVVSGDMSILPDEIKKSVLYYTKKTEHIASPCLNILLNYGGQQDILRAVKLVNEKNEELNLSSISENLYNNIPPLDLVIRPGGEHRLSNFMLWQASYAELYFCDVLWPDFNKEETEKALLWFSTRKRRYGKL